LGNYFNIIIFFEVINKTLEIKLRENRKEDMNMRKANLRWFEIKGEIVQAINIAEAQKTINRREAFEKKQKGQQYGKETRNNTTLNRK